MVPKYLQFVFLPENYIGINNHFEAISLYRYDFLSHYSIFMFVFSYSLLSASNYNNYIKEYWQPVRKQMRVISFDHRFRICNLKLLTSFISYCQKNNIVSFKIHKICQYILFHMKLFFILYKKPPFIPSMQYM